MRLYRRRPGFSDEVQHTSSCDGGVYPCSIPVYWLSTGRTGVEIRNQCNSQLKRSSACRGGVIDPDIVQGLIQAGDSPTWMNKTMWG